MERYLLIILIIKSHPLYMSSTNGTLWGVWGVKLSTSQLLGSMHEGQFKYQYMTRKQSIQMHCDLDPALRGCKFANLWTDQDNGWRLRVYCHFRTITCACDFSSTHNNNTEGIILGSDFRYQDKEINYRLLVYQVRENIVKI